jgi:hypothetical protein
MSLDRLIHALKSQSGLPKLETQSALTRPQNLAPRPMNGDLLLQRPLV